MANLLIYDDEYVLKLFQQNENEQELRKLLIEIHSTSTFLNSFLVEMSECEGDFAEKLDTAFNNLSFLNLEKLEEINDFLLLHLLNMDNGKETFDEAYSALSYLYRYLRYLEDEDFSIDQIKEAENALCVIRKEQKELLDAINEGEEESSDEIEEEESSEW